MVPSEKKNFKINRKRLNYQKVAPEEQDGEVQVFGACWAAFKLEKQCSILFAAQNFFSYHISW